MAETEGTETEQSVAAAATPAPAGGSAQPDDGLTPKERRRRSRSTHTGKAGTPRSAEERQAERVAERRKKAAHRSARRRQEREKDAQRRSSTPPAAELPPVHEPKRGAPKERQGIVVSSKADKTITVRIDVARQHRRYEKIVRSSTTLHAHDESNDANEGDLVRVVESRPLSRTKRWRLVDVLERAR